MIRNTYDNINVFGYVAAAGAISSEVNIWQPQVLWTHPVTAVAMEFLSSSASDTASAGTGARRILVIGLDANYVEQVEVVVMNGITAVQSAYTWMVINTMVTYDDATLGFGSTKNNVGNITARISGGGATQGYIPAGFNISQSGKYTVPAGYQLAINNFFSLGNKTGSPTSSYSTNSLIIGPTGMAIHGLPLTMTNGGILQIALPNTPVIINEKTTLAFTVTATSVAGIDISMGATGLLTSLTSGVDIYRTTI